MAGAQSEGKAGVWGPSQQQMKTRPVANKEGMGHWASHFDFIYPTGFWGWGADSGSWEQAGKTWVGLCLQ